jgi:hypothetical protein
MRAARPGRDCARHERLFDQGLSAMRVDLFDFDLPPENIALRPVSPRDSARLLLVPGDGAMADHVVRDLPLLLRAGDVLVFNDTKVIPAQLEGMRGEARIGATLHKRQGLRQWQAFLRNAKRVRAGDRIDFGAGVTAIAGPRDEDGGVTLDFEGDEPVEVLLERAGRMPLPPYIASKRPTDERDRSDYQTMFAREDGNADAACGGGDVPAGQGGRYRRSPDARGMGTDRRGHGGSAECRAGGGRPPDRGGHHIAAPAGKRGGGRWDHPPICG